MTPETKLLAYDDMEFELGLTPWLAFEDFIDELSMAEKTQRRVVLVLAQANRIATKRLRDPDFKEQDFERSFLFVTASSEAFEGRTLARDSEVDIALDTLHGFIAAGAFTRAHAEGRYYTAAYYYQSGPSVRRPITEFVNRFVADAVKS